MRDILGFLTSPEIIVVYVVAALACALCLIIYIVEKNNVKIRQRHNTRELNKLVEEVREEANIEETPVLYEEPVLETISDNNDLASSVNELLERTAEMNAIREEVVTVEEVEQKNETPIIIEPMDIVTEVYEDEPEKEEVELEYTSIEPDQATAQLELKKLEDELRRQEELQSNTTEETISNYEEQQEENAIISLEELVRKSKDIYEANELTQYKDEGNEPISLQELEERAGLSNSDTAIYNQPFTIESVVPQSEVAEVTQEVSQVEEKNVRLDEASTISVSKDVVENGKKFKNSPIISPIYGIEHSQVEDNGLELENTANYDKLDAEIKKTNEFLMTLKELQKNLD